MVAIGIYAYYLNGMEAIGNKSHLSFYQQWELKDYTLEQCREAIALLERRVRQLTNSDYQSYMEKDIKDLGLNKRVCNVLLNAQLNTIGKIMDYGLEKLGYLTGCGSLTHKEIKEAILKDMPDNL